VWLLGNLGTVDLVSSGQVTVHASGYAIIGFRLYCLEEIHYSRSPLHTIPVDANIQIQIQIHTTQPVDLSPTHPSSLMRYNTTASGLKL
jgi:hypothetical protein